MQLCVYVDESGDLGFSDKSSRFFVVAYVITDNPTSLQTQIRRFRRKLKAAGFKIPLEFKMADDSEETALMFLRKIANLTYDAGCIAILKTAVDSRLRDKPIILYNYLVNNYMIQAVATNYSPTKIDFYFDRRYSAEGREAFDRYVSDKLSWKYKVEQNQPIPRFNVHHYGSEQIPGIQVADYIAGAVFRKLERGRHDYYAVIQKKIKYKVQWGAFDW